MLSRSEPRRHFLRAQAGAELEPFAAAGVKRMQAKRADTTPEERAMAASSKKNRWSQHVTETSDALTLEPEVFKHSDPAAIARSLRDSAEASNRRKSNPYRSAMSMLTFYI